MSSDLSTGKTIFILAVVVGCFAVLWPKVFYPMLTASVKQSAATQVVKWRDQGNVRLLSQLCFLIEEQQDPSGFSRLSDQTCIEFVRKSCGVTVNEKVAEGFRLSKDQTNLTFCLQQRFDITLDNVISAAPPPIRTKPYQSQSLPHPHVRPERPSHLHPEALHPALREKGRTLPHRTIEKQARPGPMPGVRPPMGGGGHMVPPQTKGSGAMGIIMPLYTVGIVIFFVYTIMKVLFKKSDEEDNKVPKLKDFHLDPEYRKYVFAEEYLDSSNASHRDLLKRQERESSKQRRRQDSASQPDTKIEDEQMDQLRRRLEETEKAMERLMSQMGSVTDKLTAAKITEVLSQAQSQARILKDAAEGGSDEDLTTSEAFTNTLSEDFSLPLALQRHLEELKVKDMYLKGTSAGNFGSPPISPDELESPNGRHNYIQDSAPLIATNTTLLSSLTKENDAIPIDKNSQIDGTGTEKHIQNEQFQVCKLDLQDPKPIVDFPLQVSSSLKQNIKNEKKTKEDLVLSSDIAQYDPAGGHSDREGSSDASETGADISDLKSFADNGAIEVTGSIPIPVVEEQTVPEVTYSPRFTDTLEMDEEIVAKKPITTPSLDEKQCTLPVKFAAVEHGTQTDENQKLSVLNLRTTYLIDKKEQNKGLNIKEVEDKVNEIVLDATLPMDTQLLVKEAQTGSAITNNIEIDASEIGSEPCVVTSQVSLAFIGLEQNDTDGLYTVVVPEARPKDHVDEKNINMSQQLLQKQELKAADFVEGRNDTENQEHSQKEDLKTDLNKTDIDSGNEFLNKEYDPTKCFLFCKDNKIIQQPEEITESKQENLICSEISDFPNLSLLRKEISENRLGNYSNNNLDTLQRLLKDKEESIKIISYSDFSDKTQQQAQDLPIDSHNTKNDNDNDNVPFQSLQNEEVEQRDHDDAEDGNTFIQSEEVESRVSGDENIGISHQLTDTDAKNCSFQSHTQEDTLSDKTHQQQAQEMTIDSPCNKNDFVTFQSLQNKELHKRDHADAEDSNTFHQSADVEPLERVDENISISHQLIDKEERNCSHQSNTIENTLSKKLSEDLDSKGGVEAFIINSDKQLSTDELVCDRTQEDINELNDQLCEGIIEIPETVSVESFDLTPEILHGLEEPTNEEEFIAIEFMRPPSPVPPVFDNSKIDVLDTPFLYNENIDSIPEIYKDVSKAGVQELANTLAEETTRKALQHILGLTPAEICKQQNEAITFLDPSIGATQNEKIYVVSGIASEHPLESNLNFQSNINVQEQPGEVVGSVESGGENENAFVATVHCISNVSPPGSPFASDINTLFSLQNVNLTDHCTQSVTPTPLIEDPTLKSVDGCTKELRSPSPDSSSLIAETKREQESAFKRSTFDTHESDMNHKG